MGLINNGIKATDLIAFRESVNVGDELKVTSKKNMSKDLKEVFSDVYKRHVEILRVKEKHKYFVVMESGEAFTWQEMYIWNVLGKKSDKL